MKSVRATLLKAGLDQPPPSVRELAQLYGLTESISLLRLIEEIEGWLSRGAPRIRLHIKVLSEPYEPVAWQLKQMRRAYAGIIRVDVLSSETLDVTRPELAILNDLDIDSCVSTHITAEQTALFAYRLGIGSYEIVVYFVRSTVEPTGGCAAHLSMNPAAVVANLGPYIALAHEVGHVLGIHAHSPDDPTRVMYTGDPPGFADPPLHFTPEEIGKILSSPLIFKV